MAVVLTAMLVLGAGLLIVFAAQLHGAWPYVAAILSLIGGGLLFKLMRRSTDTARSAVGVAR